jgi:hypothetical protein
MEVNKIIQYEPLRPNRFIVEFTEGIQVETWRVMGVEKPNNNREFKFKIIETIGGINFLNLNLYNLEVVFRIDYLDPTGVSVISETYRGRVVGQATTNLDMEKDDLLYTYLTVEIDI